MDGAYETGAQLSAAFRGCEGLPADLDPRVYAARILEMPEHEALTAGGAVIDWLFRGIEKRKKGRRILGTCYQPGVQGDLADLFTHLLAQHCGRTPDFLIILDWQWWMEASPRAREILCFHELKHADQARDVFGVPRFDREGMPIWALRAHDLEEFNDVVRRYGVHDADVEKFLGAVAEHMERG
jgi:hypothetical protein